MNMQVQALDAEAAQAALATYRPDLTTKQLFGAVFNCDAMRNDSRWDATTSGILERSLEFVRTAVFKQRYAGFTMRSLVADPASPTPVGASTITYRAQDVFGTAQFFANKAEDLPVIGVTADEATKKVHPFGAKYTWSLIDLQRAAFAGVPLNADKALATQLAVERLLERVLAVGTPTNNLGLEGLFNLTGPNVTGTPATNWATETFENILLQLLAMEKSIYDRNKGVVPSSSFRLVLASEDWASAVTKIDASGSKRINVLQQFLENSQLVSQVDRHYLLNAAGAGGKNRQVMYPMNDSLSAEKQIPMSPTMLPVFQTGSMTFEQVMIASTAGVITHDATQIEYLDTPA